jgi:hypothetical protein
MNLTSVDILHGLYIAVGIMLIVVLYHVIFIVVDLRKTMRRVASVSEEVDTVIMKPLSMADQAMQYVKGFLEEKAKHHAKKHDGE